MSDMLGKMDQTQRLLATAQLQANLLDFWYDVDHAWGGKASDYYSEDGVYESGKLRLEGRAAIQKFYSWREERGARVSVHGVLNFRAQFDDNGGATSTWYMLLYAADGEAPQQSTAPTRLSLATEHYRWHEGEGRWLCTRRNLDNLFKGDAQLNVPTDLGKTA
jgi:hypothetical protein